MRERMFTMRLSKEESERLDTLAEHYGINGVGVIRMLLKREADSLASAAVVRSTADAELKGLAESYKDTPWSKKPEARAKTTKKR